MLLKCEASDLTSYASKFACSAQTILVKCGFNQMMVALNLLKDYVTAIWAVQLIGGVIT